MKDCVRVLRFLPFRKFNHLANREKGWESLGCFEVAYHDLALACNLIRGKNDNAEQSYFYFLELPCSRYKDNKGKWRKMNFFNFESNELSDQFQDTAFGIILEDHPDLFDEIFLRDRLLLKKKKESQFNGVKARNKSKFAKEKV